MSTSSSARGLVQYVDRTGLVLHCYIIYHRIDILHEKICIGETSGSALQHFWSLSGRHDNQGYSEAVEG